METTDLLSAIIDDLGGEHRPGQEQMALAVANAIAEGEHLLIEAGTGTGKSIGYLAPVVQWAAETNSRAIISTATLALQRQIMSEDAPRVVANHVKLGGKRVDVAVLKGWNNYVCLQKVNGAAGVDGFQDDLFGEATETGEEVVRVREWAKESETGDRDDLVPGVQDKVWRHVSLSKRECIAPTCPMIDECFPERARKRAMVADVVVTNHAMLGVHSTGLNLLPEADAIVVDEAHELVSRVTNQLTASVGQVELRRLARIVRSKKKSSGGIELGADALDRALRGVEGRQRRLSDDVQDALLAIGQSLRAVESSDIQVWTEPIIKLCNELHDPSTGLVVWVNDGTISAAPLDVAGPISDRIFAERAAVLTSATLQVGGRFEPMAIQTGMAFPSQGPWTGIDVGSPFDYAAQGILYVAAHLPKPAREGPQDEVHEHILELIEASGGGTLGLFSSRRAAEAAAEYVRERTTLPILCQGDDQLSTLVDEFKADPAACLFGTISLWQGVDIPGDTCRLVLIDRIPFPRPDDPISSARTELVGKTGGNGFMQVSATQAGIMLAQGAGRLIRTIYDKGVVAVLDSRLATAGYGQFLRASLPPMWPTTEKETVLTALQRLARATE